MKGQIEGRVYQGSSSCGEKCCLQMLGLAEGSIRSFVLENDPVPRALLSVDPTFTALKNSRPGAALLQLRHWLLGPGVPLTPEAEQQDDRPIELGARHWPPGAPLAEQSIFLSGEASYLSVTERCPASPSSIPYIN